MTGETGTICCSKPHQMQKLTEVTLLILLSQGINHGYAMMEKLNQLDLGLNQTNISTLYRTLRRFEDEGYVNSKWEAGGPGPRRRVYQITKSGKTYLNQWIETLKARRRWINLIIETFEKI